MVNRKKIENLFSRLNTYIEKLHHLSEYSREAFLSDFMKVESAKHLLQVSVECCLNISSHIIASKHFRNPRSYSESFEILVEEHILPETFLPTLRQMVQFRNRLVHIYWEVEGDVIYDILSNNLVDFEKFVRYILKFMDLDSEQENEKQR